MGVPGVSAPPASVPLGTSASVSEVARSPSIKVQPQVHYYRRMRTGGLHRLVVRIEPEGGVASASSVAAGNLTPVTIQPIVPGSFVTPTTADVPLRTGGEAVFHVMPLVSGKIPDARLELTISGRRFTNATLPMKANRGRLVKLLFILTLLLTLVFALVRFDAWEPYRQYRGEKAMQEFLKERMRRLGVAGTEEQPQAHLPRGIQQTAKPSDAGEETFFVSWQQPTNLNRPMTTGQGEKTTEADKPRKESEIPPPPPETRPMQPEWEARDYVYVALYKAEPLTSKTYHLLCTIQRMPLGVVYVCGGMLLLTGLCWFFQRPSRKRVQGAMLEMKA